MGHLGEHGCYLTGLASLGWCFWMCLSSASPWRVFKMLWIDVWALHTWSYSLPHPPLAVTLWDIDLHFDAGLNMDWVCHQSPRVLILVKNPPLHDLRVTLLSWWLWGKSRPRPQSLSFQEHEWEGKPKIHPPSLHFANISFFISLRQQAMTLGKSLVLNLWRWWQKPQGLR